MNITNPASNPVKVQVIPSSETSIIQKGRVYNTAYAGAAADVFDDDLTPTYTPTTFRIDVTIDAAVTCLVVRDNGVTEVDSIMNAGVALVANAEYIFDVMLTSLEAFNMEFGGVCTILYLEVTEIPGSG